MGFINCNRDCAFEQYGSCTLDDLRFACATCSDDECIHYLRRTPQKKENKKNCI